MRISPFRCLPLALLALAACSTDRAPPPSAATTPAHGTAPFSRQDFAAFRSKGIEQAARDVVPYDYWLRYRPMEATGMVAALGGEDKAVAVLKTLGLACERHGFGGKLLIVESDLPVSGDAVARPNAGLSASPVFPPALPPRHGRTAGAARRRA